MFACTTHLQRLGEQGQESIKVQFLVYQAENAHLKKQLSRALSEVVRETTLIHIGADTLKTLNGQLPIIHMDMHSEPYFVRMHHQSCLP